jgi:4-hydroxybenzoyl-CoA reductase subunit beta
MMRLPRFRYLAPSSVEEAIAWKSDAGPAAMYVAGGTDLYPNMKRRHQTPSVVIALRGLRELGGITSRGGDLAPSGTGGPAYAVRDGGDDGGVTIGAGEILSDVAAHPRVRRDYSALAHAVESISTPILRNMGTIGGNCLLDTRCTYYDQNYDWRKAIDFCMKKDGKICWVAPASPRCWAVQSSDSAPVLVAIGAEVSLLSRRGERRIPAADLYRDDGIDYLTKDPDELLTAIHLPPAGAWRATYRKLRRRGAFDFPVLGVAAWARVADDGTVEDVRVVLGGVGSHPIQVQSVGELLVGRRLEAEVIRDVADACFHPARPLDNTDFTLSWRKEMVRPFVTRALGDLAVMPAPRRDAA